MEFCVGDVDPSAHPRAPRERQEFSLQFLQIAGGFCKPRDSQVFSKQMALESTQSWYARDYKRKERRNKERKMGEEPKRDPRRSRLVTPRYADNGESKAEEKRKMGENPKKVPRRSRLIMVRLRRKRRKNG